MGRWRERARLTMGAALLGLSVAGIIARRPFRRLAAAARRRRRADPPPAGPRTGSGEGAGPPARDAPAGPGA